VRGRRLTEAARSLSNGAPDILSVALDTGYGSHEAFTRAFSRQFGADARSGAGAGRTCNLDLVSHQAGRDSDRGPQTGALRERQAAAHCRPRRALNLGEQQAIPAQWQRLVPYLDHSAPGRQNDLGVSCNGDDEGNFDYIAGTEVTDFSGLSDRLPAACDWASRNTPVFAIASTFRRSAVRSAHLDQVAPGLGTRRRRMHLASSASARRFDSRPEAGQFRKSGYRSRREEFHERDQTAQFILAAGSRRRHVASASDGRRADEWVASSDKEASPWIIGARGSSRPLLQTRQVSAVELLDARDSRRIEAHDDKLNAVVVRDFERARAVAIEADRALARGDRGAAARRSMTAQECANVAVFPTTWAFPGRSAVPVTEDAVRGEPGSKPQERWCSARRNVPLMLAGHAEVQRDLVHHQQSLGSRRTPALVGGAAAALAAGYCATRTGHRYRRLAAHPGAFCGVFRAQADPRHRALARHRAPGTPSLSVPVRQDMAVAGPMARSAGDLALALDVLAGPDALDASATSSHCRHPACRSQGLPRAAARRPSAAATSGAVRAALDAMADRLAKHGVKVARTSPLLPDLARVGRTFIQMLSAIFAADYPDDVYARLQSRAAALPPEPPACQPPGCAAMS